MAKLRLLKTGHGDLCLAEWEGDRPDTVALAESSFQEHFTKGRLAFRMNGPGETIPITCFDASAPEILLVPAIMGGSSEATAKKESVPIDQDDYIPSEPKVVPETESAEWSQS
jgi:hypothetical protein